MTFSKNRLPPIGAKRPRAHQSGTCSNAQAHASEARRPAKARRVGAALKTTRTCRSPSDQRCIEPTAHRPNKSRSNKQTHDQPSRDGHHFYWALTVLQTIPEAPPDGPNQKGRGRTQNRVFQENVNALVCFIGGDKCRSFGNNARFFRRRPRLSGDPACEGKHPFCVGFDRGEIGRRWRGVNCPTPSPRCRVGRRCG
jgi:hypothetical protein